MIFDQNGMASSNSGTIGDGAVIAATGIQLTNTDSGRIIGEGVTFTKGGSSVFNELGGIIRNGSGGIDSVAVQGSNGNDSVVNAGLIDGRIALDAGDDSFTDRDGTAYPLDLGPGDDVYRVEGGARFLYGVTAEGGAGRDRLVMANSWFQIDAGNITGFEDLVLERGGNIQRFSGFQTVTLAAGANAYYNLIDSLNPLSSVTLTASSLALRQSSLRSVTGSDQSETLELGIGGVISGGARLGGGADTFRLNGAQQVVLAQTGGILEGGSGEDTLEIVARRDEPVRRYDFTGVVGFEKLAANTNTGVVGAVMEVANLTGVTQILVGSDDRLTLSASMLAGSVVQGGLRAGGFTLAAGALVGSYMATSPSFGPTPIDLSQGDDTLSNSIVNSGTIEGDVRLYIGDDLYDGRNGTAGGMVYGNAGNDTLLGGAGNERMQGGFGADRLEGNGGDDVLSGDGGNDLLIGGLGADTLSGGAGNDVFSGTRVDMNGDRITDLSIGDRLNLTDVGLASLSFTRVGSTLTLGGTSLDLGSSNFRLAVAAAETGSDLRVIYRYSGLSDFNGDGHSDILWRHASGALSTWGVTGNVRGDQLQASAYNAQVGTDWKIVESMDWDGDGRSDILWRHDSGAVSIWKGAGGGSLQQASYNDASVSTDWKIAATGDFDGDGRDDLLWYHRGGTVSIWSSSGTGFQQNSYSHSPVGTSWHIEGSADFNGDRKGDILWRNDNGALSVWSSTGSGFAEATYSARVGRDWHVAGLADMNGDGRADILWRNDNGAVSTWSSNGTGFTQSAYNAQVGTDWKIAGLEDFNADGRADMLWRNDNGAVSTWQSNGSGFDQSVADAFASTGWSIANHEFLL